MHSRIRGHPMLMAVSLLVLDATLVVDVDKLGLSRKGAHARRMAAKLRVKSDSAKKDSDSSETSQTDDSDHSETSSISQRRFASAELRCSSVLKDIENNKLDSEDLSSLMGEMASKKLAVTDVFGCIDADLRLGPSLVRSSGALRDAFEKDRNIIDMCIATDVDGVDFACGIAADIAAQFKKCEASIVGMQFNAADRFLARVRRTEERSGAHRHRQGGSKLAQNIDGRTTAAKLVAAPVTTTTHIAAGTSSPSESPSVQEEKINECLPLSPIEAARLLEMEEVRYLLPRVVIFAAESCQPDVIRTMQDSVSAILPGAIVLPQKQ